MQPKNGVSESAESAPKFGVSESAESTSARLGRCGGDAVVKDRRLPKRQAREHYAPAGLSGWKIGFRIREVTEKAGVRPLNPTMFSRITSTASWTSRAMVHHEGHEGVTKNTKGPVAGGSRQGDAIIGGGPRPAEGETCLAPVVSFVPLPSCSL